MTDMKSIRFPTPAADEMVRAILNGRKTVTRRVVKPQPVWSGCDMRWDWKDVGWWRDGWNPIETITWKNTPYRPGDILYVRETWAQSTGGIVYKASLPYEMPKWYPSIYMPREAARIFLRVTDVRVERLQDITEEQARAEGAHEIPWVFAVDDVDGKIKSGPMQTVIQNFAGIWNSTIKPKDLALYSWEASPWVWVIEFERCEKPEGD